MPTGRCHCETVVYSFDGPVTDASCCHCRTCRRLCGSAFGAYGSVLASGFEWVRGAERVARYAPTARLTKAFCSACGSPLTTTHAREPGVVFLSLGSLDDASGITLLYHQFAASAAEWHRIGDSLPRHEDWPPE
ncbi:MAG: GFA family protein [Myxococcota bacterium]|nr:GFA family protein [Myxococcota bacterium]